MHSMCIRKTMVVFDIVRVRINAIRFTFLRLTFELSKLESLRDVSITRIGDTFPTVFRRLCKRVGMKEG